MDGFGPLVDAEWLAGHSDDVVIADVRWYLDGRSGRVGAADRRVIAYCGSGVSACHDLLAIRHAGLEDGRLFVGSWSAWGSDPDRPLAVA